MITFRPARWRVSVRFLAADGLEAAFELLKAV
jgi:hypothetical protein